MRTDHTLDIDTLATDPLSIRSVHGRVEVWTPFEKDGVAFHVTPLKNRMAVRAGKEEALPWLTKTNEFAAELAGLLDKYSIPHDPVEVLP